MYIYEVLDEIMGILVLCVFWSCVVGQTFDAFLVEHVILLFPNSIFLLLSFCL